MAQIAVINEGMQRKYSYNSCVHRSQFRTWEFPKGNGYSDLNIITNEVLIQNNPQLSLKHLDYSTLQETP